MANALTADARTIVSPSPNDIPDSNEIMCNCVALYEFQYQ